MLVSGLLLAAAAAVMAVVTAYLLAWAAEARTRLAAAVVLFLLVMMLSMVLAAFVYFRAPGITSLVEGLWLGGALVFAGLLALALVVIRGALSRAGVGNAEPAPPPAPNGRFAASVVGLVLLNEVVMGAAFTLASGVPSGGIGGAGAGVAGALASVVDSPWFLFTMSAEMLLTALLLRGRIDRALFPVLLVQSAIMFLSPPALAAGYWSASSIYLGSAAMVALFVYQMEFVYRHPELNRAFARYTVRLLAIYTAMMAGLYVWLVYGSGLLFAASIVLEMVVFLDAVLRPEPFGNEDRFLWSLRPRWAFELLGGVFLTELFMGGLLDVQVRGSAFLAMLPSAPLQGGLLPVVEHSLSNGFWFLAVVTGSTWFLLMMGAEMGALVAFKIRETHRTDLKIRLGLMLGAFALFTVYFPGFWTTIPAAGRTAIADVPVVGWTMGIGSGGPLAPTFFVAIGLSYAAIGALSFLFGRRVLCSVLCSAPTMYQGTLIDSMKSFNRTGVVGRKYLSSRFSAAYSVTAGVVLVSLAGCSVASYLDSVGRLQWTVGGTDPTVFLYSLYFGVLWYLLFVTIPYTGNYNCVTMGWCHWGTFSQAFSRLGFFRLKVRDREVCRACRTVDCSKACPVGLVDMPSQFRAKGEFRSSKCCGVGDCINACPYGNMYIYDARDFFRSRLGIGQPPPDITRLPMVRASPAVAAAPSGAAPNAAPPMGAAATRAAASGRPAPGH
jgi:hypothetical protein